MMFFDISLKQEFSLLRIKFFSGRTICSDIVDGTKRDGLIKYKKIYKDYAVTELGEIELSEWIKLAFELIHKYHEIEIFKRLQREFTLTIHRQENEKEQYALELHISRIFENPDWVDYNKWHKLNYLINKGDVKMINKALEKLEAELQKNIDNRTMIRVGDYAKEQIKKSDANAQKFLDETKSLQGAIDKMKDTAKKVAVGGVACLTDDEGFEIVHKYFGFSNEKTANIVTSSPASGVSIDLLDFL